MVSEKDARRRNAHIAGSARRARAFRAPKVRLPFHARGAVELRDATHAVCSESAPARPPRARIGPHHGSPRHLQGCEGVPGGTVPGGTIGPQFRRTGVPVRRVVFDVGHVCAVAAA